MSLPFFKMSPLNLQNQYTYLKKKKNTKSDPLSDFSRQLARSKENRLPQLDTKYINSARKVEEQLSALKLLLLARQRKQQQILSEQRFRPNYPQFIMQMPTGGYYLIQHPQLPQHPQPIPNPQRQPEKQKLESAQPIVEQPKEQSPKQIKIPEPETDERGPKAINRFQNKSKLRRFRICAYAVYFSIYIKYFSKKFTQNRKNWFDERYAINNGKVVFDGSANILRQLYQVDIYKMTMDGKKRAKQIDTDVLTISKQNEKKSTFIGGTANFTLILLQYLSQLMTSQKFIEQNHEVFTVGVLNQNFMISNLYLPQQANILHIHPAGYIQIDEETQILMLMIKIIVKITVYNYLLSLRFSRQWNLRQQKSYNLDQTDIEELWEITRTAGIFFVMACEEIYQSTVKNFHHTCNFAEIAPKFGIVAAKNLEQNKDRRNFTSQETSTQPQQKINETVPRSKFINNLQKYNEVAAMVAKTPYLQRFKQKLKMKIIDFLTEVYTCLKYEEYYVYDFIRNMTVEEKYLILQAKRKEMEIKAQNKKKNKKNKKKDSDKNVSFFGEIAERQKRRKSNASQFGGQSDILRENNSINSIDPYSKNQSIEYGDDSDEDEQPGKEIGKKMRYKHQQLFHDRKFRGHTKLEKLKGKMKVLKTKKVI